jgi:hypothetical protein
MEKSPRRDLWNAKNTAVNKLNKLMEDLRKEAQISVTEIDPANVEMP